MTMSPRAIVTGTTMDYGRHCQLEFGEYVQMHEEHDNLMNTRTTGALALRPTGNAQGGYFLWVSPPAVISIDTNELRYPCRRKSLTGFMFWHVAAHSTRQVSYLLIAMGLPLSTTMTTMTWLGGQADNDDSTYVPDDGNDDSSDDENNDDDSDHENTDYNSDHDSDDDDDGPTAGVPDNKADGTGPDENEPEDEDEPEDDEDENGTADDEDDGDDSGIIAAEPTKTDNEAEAAHRHLSLNVKWMLNMGPGLVDTDSAQGSRGATRTCTQCTMPRWPNLKYHSDPVRCQQRLESIW